MAKSSHHRAILVPALGLPIHPCPLGQSLPMPCLQNCPPHLLPVGRDDADLLGGHPGAASLALALQQLLEVVEQDLNFGRVEE